MGDTISSGGQSQIANQLGGYGNIAMQGQMQTAMNQQGQDFNKELMGIQHGNQMDLNRWGAKNQMDLWNKTGAEAQVKKLKEAGLNPALMYKQGAPSGTTGSQTGGGAGSGKFSHAPMMDISGLMEAQSRIKLNNETARKQGEEADAISGYKKDNMEMGTEGQRLENVNKEIVNANTSEMMKAEIDNYWSVILNRDVDTETAEKSQEAVIQKAYNDNLQVIGQNKKIAQEIKNLKSQKNLTDRQFKAIEAELYIKAEQLSINKQNADTAALTLLVNKEMKSRGLDITETKMWVDAVVGTLGNVIKALPTTSTVTKTLQTGAKK